MLLHPNALLSSTERHAAELLPCLQFVFKIAKTMKTLKIEHDSALGEVFLV